MSASRAKEVSIKLQLMIEEVNQSFGHAKEVIMAAYTQALAEGFRPKEAKNLILSSVKTISPRTIYYYLPNESKDSKMRQLALKKNSLQNCSDKKDRGDNKDLLDSNDAGHIKESKRDPFIENLSNELDSRKVTKDMYSVSASLESNKFDGTVQPVSQENHELTIKSVILLPEKYTDYICDKTQTNRTFGKASRFSLEHDGNMVTAVHDFSII